MSGINVAYRLFLSEQAERQVEELVKSGNKASVIKLGKLLNELSIHPKTGTGKPEKMKYHPLGWSRRIDHKNRLVYTIDDVFATVTVDSVLGHYSDK